MNPTLRAITLAPLLSLLAAHALPASAESLLLPPDTWSLAQSGKFEAWADRRALLVLHHPWDVSEKGHAATAERDVTIPADWAPPLRLHFYATDDYDATRDPLTEDWLGQINLRGHRFKELHINGETVWREDVADSADIAAPSRFSVDLPPSIAPGDTVRIAFRLVDEAGSMERLDGDHRYIGTTDNIADADPWKFMTHLYVGDAVLTSGDTAAPPRQMPSVDIARAEHGDHWPLPQAQGKPVAFPVTLDVRHAPETDRPVPLQCGLPLPPGALRDPAALRLATPGGGAIPLHASAMSHWPDGSVRFARVTAILPPGARALQLDIDPDNAPPAPPEGGARVTFAGPGETFTASIENGPNRVETVAAMARINGESVAYRVETMQILEESLVHRELEARGRLQGEATDYGRFVIRATTFAGLPWVRLTHRIVNEHPGTLEVTELALRGSAPGLAAPEIEGAPAARIAQVAGDRWAITRADGSIETREGQADAWLHALAPDGATRLTALVRHFAGQHPIALGVNGGGLAIEIFAPTDQEPAYQPHEGEAKRHEVWLALWDAGAAPDADRAGIDWAAHPPGLFDADYFCATGAFGGAAPHDETRFPELTAFMQQTYGEIPASMFHTTGIRHFGDLPYSADEGTWRNGYYDVQQGLFSEYLMTGDARWFDHLEAAVRHIMDVDVCYASAEHPDWVGSLRGYFNPDHSTGGPWNPTQRTKGMLNYWRITGDRDARDAALGVADSAAAGRAIGSVSVRDHAGVLYGLVAAYNETRDPKYRDATRALAHDAMKRIDPRRGTYPEIHGNVSYRGNVPWMVAQLMEPMYDYYRLTGDVDAAATVVAMAESILAENRTRGVDGDVYGYSHNPHFQKNSGYHVLIAPAILYAYELTGDAEFLKQGRAMYRQTIAEGTVNSVMNCYWNTHTLLYYLDRYAGE